MRTPLPPFHWVLSLSRGCTKFNSVRKYYPFFKKGKDDLPEDFSADQIALTTHDPYLLVQHSLARQPNPVITHWSTTTNHDICPLHQIQHEVIQATACHKYFVTFYNLSLVKSVVQDTPPLLNDPESALHILANALNVCREIPLWGRIAPPCEGTNCCGPTQVSIITNEIHTFCLTHVSVVIVV